MTLAIKAFGALAFMFATAVANAGPLDFMKKIDFEMTGTVYDVDTKEPIEGAYVLAPYKVFRGDLAASGTFCFKTRGMYTGKDGKYHFPVEKLDGRNPYLTNAIKSGYYLKEVVIPDPKSWVKQNAATYRDRDIYLKKQDPAKPVWQFGNGDEVCTEARTREAAAAGVTFMKLKLAEYDRYNAPEQGRRSSREQINRYESLPAESAENPKN